MKKPFPSALLDKLISHRGLRIGRVQENTLEAFRAARAKGITHFETDLQCTKDGKIVLSHDAHLTRLYQLPQAISDFDYEELATLTKAQGQPLVLLETLLEEFGDDRWIFDLKPTSGRRIISLLTGMAKNPTFQDLLMSRARFLLWRREQVQEISRSMPEAVILPGEFSCWRAGLSVLFHLPFFGSIRPGSSYAVPYRLRSKVILTEDLVQTYHRFGAKVMAYLPPPQRDLWIHFHHIGVDEILVDEWPL